MVIIILALCIPITSMVTGYFAFKGVQYGLRWRQETDKGLAPTIDKTPITSPFSKPQPPQYTNDMIDEWLNGAKEDDK